ncbi:MAG: DUF4344 domain-containing metallopeptidase [Hyphomicrobiaceae bacterium]
MKFFVAAIAACTLFGTVNSMPAVAANKTNQIKFVYVPPEDPDLKEVYEKLKSRRVLERLKEFLKPFKLPRPLTFRLSDCDGEDDAFYGDDQITICYEYVDELWYHMPKRKTRAGVAPIDAVVGPFFDTSLHEFAHALIEMYELPVLGRLEDAADQVAAYIYLQLGPEESRRLVKGTAYAYLTEAKRERTKSWKQFWDEHSTPAQRAYNVMCIAYGADTKLFSDLVSKKFLPEERAELCEEEYEQIQDAYEELIQPHVDEALAEKVFSRTWWRKAP